MAIQTIHFHQKIFLHALSLINWVLELLKNILHLIKKSGNDHYHSMDLNDANLIINQIKNLREYIGYSKSKNYIKSEIKPRKFARRSIVAKVNILNGEKFTTSNITTKDLVMGCHP